MVAHIQSSSQCKECPKFGVNFKSVQYVQTGMDYPSPIVAEHSSTLVSEAYPSPHAKTRCLYSKSMGQQVGHVQAERDVLAASDNAWVVGLEYSFQDPVNLYMVRLQVRKGCRGNRARPCS